MMASQEVPMKFCEIEIGDKDNPTYISLPVPVVSDYLVQADRPKYWVAAFANMMGDNYPLRKAVGEAINKDPWQITAADADAIKPLRDLFVCEYLEEWKE